MSFQPSSDGGLQGLAADLSSGQFFRCLADLECVRDRKFRKWLRLAPSQILEGWMHGAGSALLRTHLNCGDPSYRPLVRLVLERHVLHLSTRRRPGPLIQYCEQLPVPAAVELAELWRQVDLPASMAAPSVREQERDFAARLLWVAERIQPSLPWIAEKIRECAEGRAADLAEADGACVRVIFASAVDSLLRSGAMVRFVLLAEGDGSGPLVQHENVFDADFKSALAEVRDRLTSQRFRILQHDWDFLPPRTLRDTSGFLPVWVAQELARKLDSQGLPAWVLLSGSLAPDGARVAAPGYLSRKCAHLIEEGVRILMIKGEYECPEVVIHTAEEEGIRVPGARDLLIVRCRDHKQAMTALNERGWTWPVSTVGTRRPFASMDWNRVMSVLSSIVAVGYQPPRWIIDVLLEAAASLRGRGYLAAEAPAKWGKSELAKFLKKPSDLTRPFGTVLRYRILHGAFENVATFLKLVYQQCSRAVDDAVVLPTFESDRVRDASEARQWLSDLLRQTRQACGGERLFLVIDGVDELTEPSGCLLLQVLPAVDVLPDGCYILLLSRPNLRPTIAQELTRLRSGDAVVTVSLDSNSAEYQALKKNFIEARLAQGRRPEEDSRLLSYDFLALRFHCEVRRCQKSDEGLTEPSTLFARYLENVANTVHGGTETFEAWHRPLLRCAAEAGTVCRAELRRSLNRDWDTTNLDALDRALDELVDHALLSAENRTDLRDDTYYVVAHEELADWLRSLKSQSEKP